MEIDPIELLGRRFVDAIVAAFGDEFADSDPLVRTAQNPQFGDFQSNVAMGLAKRVGRPPREVAGAILEQARLEDLCEKPEIAGPGFVNLRLRADALPRLLTQLEAELAAVAAAKTPADAPRVVVDLVGVNIAKQMHVGHLRSSIIGDSLCRVLSRVGNQVIPQNHLGDWGLQIAMVIASLRRRHVDLDSLDLDALEAAYRDANLECRADRQALETARRINAGAHRIAEWEAQVAGAEQRLDEAKSTLVRLQRGEGEIVAAWEKITAITLAACYEIYDLLDLTVTEEHNRGESFYRERLGPVVDAFISSGIAKESQGAIVVEIEGDDTPLLIRKSDGGFLYATTDLAAIRYRVQELGAQRVIYVVDARQRDHFRKVFEAVRLIGWDQLPDGSRAELRHVPFGAVCGEDGKPLKTRSGDNIKLKDLLLEAIQRAGAIVREKNPDLPPDEQHQVARAVGIGSVKYADLSTQLQKDYVFAWDRMLAFEGNTGAYLQNQYVRIRSIGRKAPDDVRGDAAFLIAAAEEKALALALLRYPGTLASVAQTLEPHRLCQYLYDLAGAFSVFYTQCPVLKAETKELRDARIRLARLTESILADGLGLLGIRTLERM
ncbi:MAG: arginine--tRNA ligase [Phycisphaerales bacterium]|nr:arginine--tRNA ligase [Phycisphaerales bacterium]